MKILAPAAVILTAALPLHAALATTVVDFEDLTLAADSYYDGSDLSGGFSSHGVQFQNEFDLFWDGFGYSNVNDPTTPGYVNQFAVSSGTGFGGTGTYAVATYDLYGEPADIVTFSAPTPVLGFYVNNTTYAALSMRDGDGFAKPFGGTTGSDPDWFRLTIRGADTAGQPTGEVAFYLADFRFADPGQDYILTDWTWVDTTALGPNVSSLHFDLASSDTGAFGMNTPAYFAMDNLVVPEPGTFGLLLIPVMLTICRSKRRTESRVP